MGLDSHCKWMTFDCNFDDVFTGSFVPVENHPSWFTGRKTIQGKLAYLSTGQSSVENPWWKKEPPKGSDNRPGPFLTFSIERAIAFKKVVVAYPIQWSELDVLFTSKAGGFETQEEVFNAGYRAYYSCKECEFSMRNDRVEEYLDWEAVKVVWVPD